MMSPAYPAEASLLCLIPLDLLQQFIETDRDVNGLDDEHLVPLMRYWAASTEDHKERVKVYLREPLGDDKLTAALTALGDIHPALFELLCTLSDAGRPVANWIRRQQPVFLQILTIFDEELRL